MHEKHLHKTYSIRKLSEVADQRPTKSIRIISHTGTSPTPHQSKSLTQPTHKPALTQERVNTEQVGMIRVNTKQADSRRYLISF